MAPDFARARNLASRYGPTAVVALAAGSALILSTTNLAGASLWHDELVHVFVARGILETGVPHLPSGMAYYNANLFNYILASWIALLGDGEAAVRLPAAVFGAANVVLAYGVLRRLLGRGPALLAAVLLAASPWQIAWSREARFYTMHQTFYLGVVWLGWRLAATRRLGRQAAWGTALAAVFCAASQVAIHSLAFLGAPAAFYGLQTLVGRGRRVRWLVLAAGSAGVTLLVFFALVHWLPAHDTSVLKDAMPSMGPAVHTGDIRHSAYYLMDWLMRNMGRSSLGLLLLGTVAAVAKRRRAGLYAVLAAWVPFVVFSFVLDYRRARFIFFAWPFLIGLMAYGAVWLGCLALKRPRRTWGWAWRIGAAVVLARASWTGLLLAGDTLQTVQRPSFTLARRHPQWREPCRYVRDRLGPGTVVIATTALPPLYYLGHLDEWYPARFLDWEGRESGLEGLAGVPELRAFMQAHPHGYFLAEDRRFGYVAALQGDVAWVRQNMRQVEEASNEDIRVYVWGDQGR